MDDPLITSADLGCRVEIELVDESGGCERMAFEIVADAQADFAAGYLGKSTPLAKALIGQSAGSVIPYRMGDVVEVRLLAVGPGSGPAVDIASRREENYQKALRQSERTNAIIYASSMNSKWGDYDPSGIEDNW